MSNFNFEYSQATLDWIKAGEERKEEEYQEYLKREKFKDDLRYYQEAINSANKKYAQFLLSQDFEFITDNKYYYWTVYLAIHKDYVETAREHIPDWAIREITEEVYNAKGEIG